VDAKTDYPAACNSVETVLIHTKSAKKLLTRLIDVLSEKKVELRLCESSFKILQEFNYDVSAKKAVKATNKDFDTEFVDLILAAKIVNSLDEAIEHINEHGSKHTDCILTTSKDNADRFMREVDSAGVYWNASTRFADGYRYGFGAEVGVSTNKTHARGPVGLEGLLIYKYRLQGDGNCASWYSSNKRSFKHETL
jgi:glutamate-5-semialdehyde dehydrogenase